MRDLEENRACEQNRATTLGWIVPFPSVGVIRGISRRFCNVKAFAELFSVISRRIGWGGKRMCFSFTSCYKESTSLAGKSSAKDATHGQEPRNLGIDRKDKVKVCACYPERLGNTREEEAWTILKLKLVFIIWPLFHLNYPGG